MNYLDESATPRSKIRFKFGIVFKRPIFGFFFKSNISHVL
jgi:hypothetical protein